MVPVGGVDEKNLPAWRKAGAGGSGIGSALDKSGNAVGQVGAKARRLVESLRQP
jgi:2-dehydro-3-deoxyphosphogalactonate aldolase